MGWVGLCRVGSYFLNFHGLGWVGLEPPTKKVRVDPFVDLRDDAATSQQTTSHIYVEDELSRYKALRVPAARTSTLLYRKEQATDYPILATVASRYEFAA